MNQIIEFEIDFQVNLYPNPAIEQLNVHIDNYKSGYSFQLYDALGKLLVVKKIESEDIVLPFSSYSTGLYFLVFLEEADKKLKTYKVQKSH